MGEFEPFIRWIIYPKLKKFRFGQKTLNWAVACRLSIKINYECCHLVFGASQNDLGQTWADEWRSNSESACKKLSFDVNLVKCPQPPLRFFSVWGKVHFLLVFLALIQKRWNFKFKLRTNAWNFFKSDFMVEISAFSSTFCVGVLPISWKLLLSKELHTV